MGRRERQRDEIDAALARGDHARVLVLAREHLAEFPDDEDVARAARVAAEANRPATPPDPDPSSR